MSNICTASRTEFYHIHPRRAGEPSQLSKFLRIDDETPLKVSRPGPRKLSVELNEMHKRAVTFETILNPLYDERDVIGRMRLRTRRSH